MRAPPPGRSGGGGWYTSLFMARSHRVRILLLATALVAFPVVLIVPGLDVGVLFLSPAIVLLASLLSGRYVGEERLRRLAAALTPQRRGRRPRAANPAPRRIRHLPMPRGGSLLATSLAVRPPPLRLAVR